MMFYYLSYKLIHISFLIDTIETYNINSIATMISIDSHSKHLSL